MALLVLVLVLMLMLILMLKLVLLLVLLLVLVLVLVLLIDSLCVAEYAVSVVHGSCIISVMRGSRVVCVCLSSLCSSVRGTVSVYVLVDLQSGGGIVCDSGRVRAV